MKKQRVSPTTNLNFKTTESLPTPEAVNKAVAEVTQKPEVVKPPQAEIIAEVEPVKKNSRKRETMKGTVLQAVMVEKDLLKLVKRKAFDDEISLSEVINTAIRQYFQ